MQKSWLILWLLILITISSCGNTEDTALTDLPAIATQTQLSQTVSPTEPIIAGESTAKPEERSVLANGLYYLAQDANGIYQIFRLDKDGKSIEQKTFETSDISSFDVSPRDGKLAFVVENNLFTMASTEDNRTTVLEGPLLENDADRKVRAIKNPLWAQDGQTLAFSFEGLNIYYPNPGVTTKLLDYELSQTGQLLWTTYIPHSFSPDGKKLLVDINKYETGNIGIYDLTTGDFRQASEIIYADTKTWSADSSAVFISEDTTSEYSSGGLWRLNASNGEIATLFVSGAWEESPSHLANCPYLGPDGKLYFFSFDDPNEYVARSPLKLIRTNADGVTGYEVLLPELFEPRECLWSQDASMVVLTQADDKGDRPATLLFINGNPAVQLIPNAREIRWGP